MARVLNLCWSLPNIIGALRNRQADEDAGKFGLRVLLRNEFYPIDAPYRHQDRQEKTGSGLMRCPFFVKLSRIAPPG
ncbi:hypothetical protein [Thalassospira lucentensis]|uniref:hypothetical protein n=1 Tax=Thalassospira lucentensis TaxID=168935 RepID=UPI00142E46F9|nr:hypothetical protein [Thalassospira lucentensis]NIZ03209.1 hypothetical protein [Thalassospira lucentensis]